MDTFETINSLYTTHGGFDARPLEPGTLGKILAASVRAGNASNAQNYFIIAVEDRTVMKEVTQHWEASAMLVYGVDFVRNMSLAKHVGKEYRYEPSWAMTTGVVDATLAAQTAVIAARALGVDSLITNGVHRGDPIRVWKALNLPPKHCFPVLALLLGYDTKAKPMPSGRLGEGWTIHHGKYQAVTGARLDELTQLHGDPSKGLWEAGAYFDGPGKRAKDAYVGWTAALAEAGIRVEAAE